MRGRIKKTGYSTVTLRNRLADMTDEVETMGKDGRCDPSSSVGIRSMILTAARLVDEEITRYHRQRQKP